MPPPLPTESSGSGGEAGSARVEDETAGATAPRASRSAAGADTGGEDETAGAGAAGGDSAGGDSGTAPASTKRKKSASRRVRRKESYKLGDNDKFPVIWDFLEYKKGWKMIRGGTLANYLYGEGITKNIMQTGEESVHYWTSGEDVVQHVLAGKDRGLTQEYHVHFQALMQIGAK